jgi:branched-chain amino acid transport system permease protein
MMGLVAGAMRLVPPLDRRWRIILAVTLLAGFLVWAISLVPDEPQNYAVIVAISAGILGLIVLPERWSIPASIAAMLVFLCWSPFMLLPFQTQQLFTVLVWFIAIIGLNILTGFNGQISLGHGALVAFGAYVCGILIDGTEQMSFIDASPWPFWLAIIAAGLVTAVLGMLLGIPALRLSGPYLAIATFALAVSFPLVMRKYDQVTGGNAGIQVNSPPVPDFFGDTLVLNQWLYFLSLFVALLMVVLAWQILRGPLGRTFTAVRDSEVAAAAMGVNVARTKITAFTISAFFAGISGGLYMTVFGLISPDAIGPLQSINLLAVTVIGGLGSLLGALIGAGTLIFIPVDAPGLVDRIPGLDQIPGMDIRGFLERAPGIIQGVLVILVMILLPTGTAGFLHTIDRIGLAGIAKILLGLPSRIRDSLSGMGTRLRPYRRSQATTGAGASVDSDEGRDA